MSIRNAKQLLPSVHFPHFSTLIANTTLNKVGSGFGGYVYLYKPSIIQGFDKEGNYYAQIVNRSPGYRSRSNESG